MVVCFDGTGIFVNELINFIVEIRARPTAEKDP